MAERVEGGRFAVLEHTWEGTHWDFLLEAGDSLRTWAIDRPIVAGHELPARVLVNHRLLYLTYEGPVSGGRGAVRRVAGGTYRVREWGPDRVRVLLEGDQLVGEVNLYRAGPESSDSSPAGVGEPWKFLLGKVD